MKAGMMADEKAVMWDNSMDDSMAEVTACSSAEKLAYIVDVPMAATTADSSEFG